MLRLAVEDIALVVREGDEASALRLAAGLYTALTTLIAADLALAIEGEPPSTGDARWDALIAGLVERAARTGGVRTPLWTAGPGRFLDRWWFVTPYRSLHATVLVQTPAELANRGVFVDEASLHTV